MGTARRDRQGPADASSRLDEAKRVGNPFTAVLLDTGIGGPEAEKLPETLALFPELRHAPLILLIPLGQPGKLSSLLGNGVAGFVNKPIVPSDLFNVLMRLTTSGSGHRRAAEERPPRETPLLPVPKTRHAGARILLAEDNAINQKVATQILKCFGYEFDIVGDGSQAVQSLRNQPYNLVLMDCQMPEMDGLEATRAIRTLEAEGAIGKGGQIPIIALTANALEGDRQNCLEAGMTDYLSKPLRPEQLLQMIEKYLEEAFRLEQPADDASADAEPESATDSCPAAPPFDLDVFVERCMGDRDFALQLLEELQTQFPGQLESLSVCLEEGALQDVVRLRTPSKAWLPTWRRTDCATPPSNSNRPLGWLILPPLDSA